MANAQKWSGVGVAMESARGTAQTITAVTKAAPGVLTTSGTPPVNGNIIFLEVEGMTQINDAAFRVIGVSGSSFSLEDIDGGSIDTSAYDAFSSGAFFIITLGTSITTATTISSSGGEFEQIDKTTIHDTQRKTIPGLPAALSYNMDHIWDVSNPGLQALNAAYKTNAKKVIQFTFAGGQKMLFGGLVGSHLAPGGQAQGLVTTNTVFTVDGFPTYLAS